MTTEATINYNTNEVQPHDMIFSADRINNYMKEEVFFVCEYQREDTVWTTTQQQLLIDSMYNHYYIPSLVLVRCKRPNKNGEIINKYKILDGQQRCTAIYKYLSDSIQYQKHYFKNLSKAIQNDFKDRNIKAIVYYEEELTPEAELEMYLRLQNGTRHNKCEKNKAINSKVVVDIKNALKSQNLIYENKENIGVTTTRDQDAGWFAQAYLLERNISENKLDSTLDSPQIEKLYKDNKNIGLNPLYVKRVNEITDMIKEVIIPYMNQLKDANYLQRNIRTKLNKTRIAILSASIRENYDKKEQFLNMTDEQKKKVIDYLFLDSASGRASVEVFRQSFKDKLEDLLIPASRELSKIIFK